jgi:hypothetical protein
LKLGDLSFGVGSHHNWNVELGVSSNKISMVVGEDNIFQCGAPLCDIVSVDEIVVGRIDDVGLAVGLDVVGENREHASLKLSDVDAGLSVF